MNDYESAGPKEALASLRKLIENMDGLDLGTGIKYDTEYVVGAKQLGGHTIDTYKMNMEMSPQMMAQMGMMSMFTQSFTSFQITTTKDAMVMGSASDDALFEATLEVEAGASLDQNAGLLAVREKWYPHRAMEIYVGGGTISPPAGP